MKDVKTIIVENNYRGQFESSLKQVEDYLKQGYNIESNLVAGIKIIYILTKNKSC